MNLFGEKCPIPTYINSLPMSPTPLYTTPNRSVYPNPPSVLGCLRLEQMIFLHRMHLELSRSSMFRPQCYRQNHCTNYGIISCLPPVMYAQIDVFRAELFFSTVVIHNLVSICYRHTRARTSSEYSPPKLHHLCPSPKKSPKPPTLSDSIQLSPADPRGRENYYVIQSS
jgi:hypothetical protein